MIMLFAFIGTIFSLDVKYTKYKENVYCSNFSLFETQLDHFSFDDRKTKIRVITDDQYYQSGGPVLFYTGNEGSIELFCENTGFQREAAQLLNAKIIFMEHRYYGKSVPDKKFKYLSSEQALADFADYLYVLKSTTDVGPIIALGGSYGGMLAAYIRLKYPNLIAGAIAASAPVKYFPGQFDSRGFARVATRTFQETLDGEICVNNIRNSWSLIHAVGAHMVGKKFLSDTFQTCEIINDTDQLTGFLEDVWGSLAMMDYPYPTDFMGNVPAWPVSKACEALNSPMKQMKLLAAIRTAASIYYNNTGDLSCIDLNGGGDSPDLGYSGWYYQTCTEFIMPFSSDGVDDMFEPKSYNYETYSNACKERFDTKPRPKFPAIYYSVESMKQIGNIIFSNGHLDPWSSGGVLDKQEAGNRNYIYTIDKGAHHLDLRSSNPDDPAQVTAFRKEYIEIMKQWITNDNASNS